MGDGILAQVCEQEWDEYCNDNYSGAYELLGKINWSIKNTPNIAEIFGQYHWPNHVSPADLLQYGRILYWMEQGQLTIVTIPFGQEPSADAEVLEMNEKLQDLPEGITARFWGGLADCDGIVKWSVPLSLNMIINGTEHKSTLMPNSYPPHARLEVGYTKYMTSHWHLYETGCLARWPYYSKNLYLIHYTGKLACENFPDFTLD